MTQWVSGILLLALTSVNAVAQEAPVKRIIALSPHAVEMLFAIGAGEQIVAATDHADYPKQALDIPRIGGYYGVVIEKVLALKPDLIVTWGDGNKSEDIEQLKKLGFKVFDSSPKALDDVAVNMISLGKLTGHEQQAQQVAEKYRQQINGLQQKYAEKLPIKVFYQLWGRPLMTVSNNSWIEQIIEICHGQNVFANSWNEYPQISTENVLVTKPQVILQSNDPSNLDAVNWLNWPEIPAVEMNNVFVMNADYLHRAGPRTPLGVAQVCNALQKGRQHIHSSVE